MSLCQTLTEANLIRVIEYKIFTWLLKEANTVNMTFAHAVLSKIPQLDFETYADAFNIVPDDVRTVKSYIRKVINQINFNYEVTGPVKRQLMKRVIILKCKELIFEKGLVYKIQRAIINIILNIIKAVMTLDVAWEIIIEDTLKDVILEFLLKMEYSSYVVNHYFNLPGPQLEALRVFTDNILYILHHGDLDSFINYCNGIHINPKINTVNTAMIRRMQSSTAFISPIVDTVEIFENLFEESVENFIWRNNLYNSGASCPICFCESSNMILCENSHHTCQSCFERVKPFCGECRCRYTFPLTFWRKSPM